MPKSDTVSGTVVLADDSPPGAVLHVTVEDVTRSDAASRVAARLDLPLVDSIARGEALPFEVSIDDVDDTRRYVVRAHVDASGNGRIETGDQISTQSCPVLTQGSPRVVRIPTTHLKD